MKGLRSEIKRRVAAFELNSYKMVLNKGLVVERGLIIDDGKKDRKTKKMAEPLNRFNETGASRKFNIRGNGGNVNRASSGNKLSCSRSRRNHLDKDCRWNTGACFSCGEIGYKVSEC